MNRDRRFLGKKFYRSRAWTLVEMIMVLSLVSMLFIVILPQFRILYKSWDLKEASAETMQHGRVLFDHLHRELSMATEITVISPASQLLGYIEYMDPDGQTWRYEAGGDNYVFYGQPGNLSLLAGPVSQFQISGYTTDDLQNPIAEVETIRLVRIQTELISPTHPGKTSRFSFSGYLRTSKDTSIPTVLFVVEDPALLSDYEQRLFTRFESWGYVIQLINNDATQESFDTAVLTVDVIYIPVTCDCQALGSKLMLAPIGVVSEHMNCHDDMNYTSQEATTISTGEIRIQDNTHPITAPYSMDQEVTVLSVGFGNLLRIRGALASGMQRLARRTLQSHPMMGAIETNGLLQGGQPSPARRVILPWGSDTFDNSWLNEEGWGIIQRSIEWAAGE